MQSTYVAQPLPYMNTPQVIQPTYPGFNGASKHAKYNRKAAMGLGITQMIIGVICLILNSVLIALGPSLSALGYGIWGGTLIFIAGLLQVLSSKKAENICLITGTMVMNIVAAFTCVFIFFLSINEAASGNGMIPLDYQLGTSRLALGTVMAVLAFVEALIAIATSVLCCDAVCCGSPSGRNNLEIPVDVVGDQSVRLPTYQPGLALQSGQSTFPCRPSAPRVSTNHGLSNISYS